MNSFGFRTPFKLTWPSQSEGAALTRDLEEHSRPCSVT